MDQDATIIESHKQQALTTYEGVRGYQPMLAVWAETGLVLADQFRDGHVAIRIRKKQGELFEDGSAVRHFAVLSNRWELKAARLIEWHRQKAGTIEFVHDVIKNDLGGGVLPSKYFGANAAWLRLAVIAHNVLVALKRLALPPELLTARPKRLRFLIFNTPGRRVRHARNLLLRLATAAQWTAVYREGMRLLPVIT